MCEVNDGVKFSLVIPTYGRADKLKILLSSIINATSKIEVVIVDDNGRGTEAQRNTSSLLEEFLDNKQVKYIVLDNNVGAAQARNEGVKESGCEVITFIDDDDTIYVDRLIEKYNYFIKTDSHVCGSNMDVSGDVSKWRFFKSPIERRFLSKSPREMLIRGNCFTPMIMIYKNKFLDIDGFENVSYFQDHVFLLKCHIANLSVSVFSKPTFCHNIHNGLRVTKNQKSNTDGIIKRLQLEEKLRYSISLNLFDSMSYKFKKNELSYYKKSIDGNVSRFGKVFIILFKLMPYSTSFSRFLISIKLLLKAVWNG